MVDVEFAYDRIEFVIGSVGVGFVKVFAEVATGIFGGVECLAVEADSACPVGDLKHVVVSLVERM